MKKFAVLVLTVAALALTASDAFAFGRRCGGGRIFHRPACNSCGQAVTVTSPTPPANGEIRYFPEYQPTTNAQPAQDQPAPVTAGTAPVTTFNGCSNGTCNTPTRVFGFFRRR